MSFLSTFNYTAYCSVEEILVARMTSCFDKIVWALIPCWRRQVFNNAIRRILKNAITSATNSWSRHLYRTSAKPTKNHGYEKFVRIFIVFFYVQMKLCVRRIETKVSLWCETLLIWITSEICFVLDASKVRWVWTKLAFRISVVIICAVSHRYYYCLYAQVCVQWL